MQALDIAQETATAPDAELMNCCLAYRLINSTLFEILANTESVDPYTSMLKRIEDMMLARASAIYHFSTGTTEPTLVACTDDMSRYSAIVQKFAIMLDQSKPKSELWYCDNSLSRLIIKAMQMEGEKGTEYSLLILIYDEAQSLIKTQANVIEIFAQGFSEIFLATRQAHVNRRRMVQNERASISRELHDSLAQSLTYLKIQASRIQSIFENDRDKLVEDDSEFCLVVNDLRDNLKIAYRQLRELMTTFRLTVNGESFNQAVEDSVNEFEKRIGIAFDLDNRLSDDELTVDEEMQTLHIIREALSNIVRHSHAKCARIALGHYDDNTVRITISDDGVGIDNTQRRAKHLGLIIMQERSINLGGNFNVKEQAGGGTEIQVTFTPQKSSAHINTNLY